MSEDPRKKTQYFNDCLEKVQSSVRELHDISSNNSKKLDTLTLAVCGDHTLNIEGIAPTQKRMQKEHSELKVTVGNLVIDKKVLLKTAAIIATLVTVITSGIWALGQLILSLIKP